ncbi:uncharacterized protein LOC111796064 [Cucurbita pepo subsp. pepo]|uniref:uncharacterized protein LOC111796064 n=1 Tax=Cucurbita pepo subsp. pepo TaxID=3664 RepID=UPI000C9DA1C1|nr:uncharacterized protein LOC111796064 [Cucurbita pepo subsp. pepo]
MKNIVGILASREISTNTKKITESQRRLHSCVEEYTLKHCSTVTIFHSTTIPQGIIEFFQGGDLFYCRSAILEDNPKVFEWITSCQLPVRSIIKFDESNWNFVQALQWHQNASISTHLALIFMTGEVAVIENAGHECHYITSRPTLIDRSISLHAEEEILAFTIDKELHIWRYNQDNHSHAILSASGTIKKVQFHPLGAPYILTAEVNNCKNLKRSVLITFRSYHPEGSNDILLTTTSTAPDFSIVVDESAEAASTFRIRRKVTNFCPLTIEMNPLITFNPPASESLIMEEQTVVECLRVVGLKIWQYDAKADNVLENERLCIPNVVLNCERSADISPCGKFLVACVVNRQKADEKIFKLFYEQLDDSTLCTLVYDIRVYSIADCSFGRVLKTKGIKAGYAVNAIQFSPTSKYIVVGYGRRHYSLKGIGWPCPYTILEIYRISDMKLIRSISSHTAVINVARFHPKPGEGVVYCTKELKGGRIIALKGYPENEEN